MSQEQQAPPADEPDDDEDEGPTAPRTYMIYDTEAQKYVWLCMACGKRVERRRSWQTCRCPGREVG